ncbi:MAG: apolipoprotein N-acyltransferase [Nitrospirales bacterium]|nr:apolipoprotein N-acyltransferase [Nitrospirales bacterium]
MLVPLHWALTGLTSRQAFRWGWLAGSIAFAGTITWVITAMNQYGQVPFAVSSTLMLLLATYLGLFMGAYAWGCVTFQKTYPDIVWLAAPTLWVTLEYLRTYAFSGLPWALLGYSQYEWLTLIQFADITGVYGVSFLVVMANVVLFHCLTWITTTNRAFATSKEWTPLAGFAATLALILAYGTWQLYHQHSLDETAETLTIGIVQANIEQGKKWDERYRDETMDRYARLSLQAGQNTDLLIWPEAATPFLFEQEPEYQGEIRRIVQATNSPLLFGSPTVRFHPDGRPYLFNSAFLLDREGQISDRYDKRHLVPFGEYIPLKSVLFFLDKLVVGIGDFQEGQGHMTMTVTTPRLKSATRFGVPICFEVIFPDLVRRMAQEGANMLITITNDAWFGDSVAPYQHFGMVVFRAVENHLAFARAANTGISGFIAPDGAILDATPVFTEQARTSTIPLRRTVTFYAQFGDVFSWICVILTGILAIGNRLGARASLKRST